MVNRHTVEEAQHTQIVSLPGGSGEHLNIVGTSGSHAVIIIVVVCVGFLLFMIILGVFRIRAAHQKSTNEEVQESEMTWDDTALTITVNPLEVRFNAQNTFKQ